MNTKQLQKQFKSDYEDLYSNSDIVTSGCFGFTWFPVGLGHSSNRINIKSKLPLKAYVGLKKAKDKQIKFNDLAVFDIDNNKFTYEPFNLINSKSKEIIEFIEGLLLEKGLNFGIEINVLSEVARGHGLGFSGTIFVTMITAVFLLGGLLDKQTLDRYGQFKESEAFQEILLLARKLEFISKHGNTGSAPISTINDLQSPTIYFTEDSEENEELSGLDNKKYYFSNFSKKFGSEGNLGEISFDYAILYTGSLGNTTRMTQLKKTDKNSFKVYEDFFHNELEKEIKGKHYISKIFDKESFYDGLNEVGSNLTIETAYIFKQIMDFGDANQNIDLLINNINKLSSISDIVEGSGEFIEDFKYFFKKNSVDINEELGVMPIYSGKRGGDFLVVMRHGSSRKAFDDTIKDLETKYDNIKEQYTSWIDSPVSEGIKLEQFVSGGEYSQHVNKDNVLYINNQGDKYMDEYGDIIQKEVSGFLLDSISGKIYLNGVKLTSKDIKSQSTTIELFDLLLDNIGEEVYNNQLSPSTYASQQNQMLGKIIMPFVKLVEREFHEKLPLICKGSLRQFYVRLAETNIKIGIIKKI